MLRHPLKSLPRNASPPHRGGNRLALVFPTQLNSRRGITLLELITCGCLLAVLGGTMVPLLQRLDQAQERNRAYRAALLELENLAERNANLSFRELTLQKLRDAVDSSNIAQRLPGTTIDISLHEERSNPSGKRVTYRLVSQSDTTTKPAPFVLEQWFFDEKGP